MDIFKDAVEDSAAKLTKSFEKILIEVIILFMVIPQSQEVHAAQVARGLSIMVVISISVVMVMPMTISIMVQVVESTLSLS